MTIQTTGLIFEYLFSNFSWHKIPTSQQMTEAGASFSFDLELTSPTRAVFTVALTLDIRLEPLLHLSLYDKKVVIFRWEKPYFDKNLVNVFSGWFWFTIGLMFLIFKKIDMDYNIITVDNNYENYYLNNHLERKNENWLLKN